MSNQTNNEKQHPEREASQQGFIELGDEQLEQVSGGMFGNSFFIRGLTDLASLGTAEAYWNTKSGKKKLSQLS